MKVFMGDMFPSLQRALEKRFQSVKVHSPDASRPTSSEVYVICKGFYGTTVKLENLDATEKKPEFKAKGGFI